MVGNSYFSWGNSSSVTLTPAVEEKRIINLHKPDPRNIVKQYVIKQILEKLALWKII